MSNFSQEVAEKKAQIPKPKGAFGRRHDSRGLKGFYDPKAAGKRKHRPGQELTGLRLMEALLDSGHVKDAEAVYQQLLAEGK